ncbi:MAG: helix-turn-helix domain-containing protein [Myxococcales bacterium]|nr:helix-turn-helix domain-containing protein [Myxococcales bacterium]
MTGRDSKPVLGPGTTYPGTDRTARYGTGSEPEDHSDVAALPDACGSPETVHPLEDSDPVITVSELAALLRIERKAAYAAIQRGEIPGVRRIGRSIRVSKSAVLGWLRDGQGRVSRRRR